MWYSPVESVTAAFLTGAPSDLSVTMPFSWVVAVGGLTMRRVDSFFIDSGEILSYNCEVIFEWDENKAKSNLRKHKIGFDEAETVFYDPFVVTFSDEFHLHNDEERFISIGLSNVNRVLLVVHTEVSDNDNEILVRIISCRKATVLESKIYEEQF